jgi:hypothetical protein
VIRNNAAIYFDYNEPVITNTTFHTIRKYITLLSAVHETGTRTVRIMPNPVSDYADLLFEQEMKDVRFELYDSFGKLVSTGTITGNRYRLERNGLPPGTYTFRAGGFAGKAIITD